VAVKKKEKLSQEKMLEIEVKDKGRLRDINGLLLEMVQLRERVIEEPVE
jgi:hypothetical protein